MQVTDSSEHVESLLLAARILFAGTVRLPETAKIDGQDRVSSRSKCGNLFRPAFLGESATMNEQHSAFARAILQRGDGGAVLSGERDGLLGERGGGEGKGGDDGKKRAHTANVLRKPYPALIGS